MGSKPRYLDRADVWHTLTQVLLVAGAGALASIVPQLPALLGGQSLFLPLATGILTLLARWLQDNTR